MTIKSIPLDIISTPAVVNAIPIAALIIFAVVVIIINIRNRRVH
jgi:hypothetical protein